MTINYTYHKDRGYLRCTVSDKVTLTDVLTYIDTLIDDPTVIDPFFEIVDFSNSTNFDFGYYQTDQLISKLEQLKNLSNYQGSLFVADKDYLRGMVNIFKVIADDKGINVKEFSSLDEAIDFVHNHFA